MGKNTYMKRVLIKLAMFQSYIQSYIPSEKITVIKLQSNDPANVNKEKNERTVFNNEKTSSNVHLFGKHLAAFGFKLSGSLQLNRNFDKYFIFTFLCDLCVLFQMIWSQKNVNVQQRRNTLSSVQ